MAATVAYHDITGFGLAIVLTASVTFPAGMAITSYADDSDALDVPSIKIAETAMGLNGDGIKWSKAVMNPITISVIRPGNVGASTASWSPPGRKAIALVGPRPDIRGSASWEEARPDRSATRP